MGDAARPEEHLAGLELELPAARLAKKPAFEQEDDLVLLVMDVHREARSTRVRIHEHAHRAARLGGGGQDANGHPAGEDDRLGARDAVGKGLDVGGIGV